MYRFYSVLFACAILSATPKVSSGQLPKPQSTILGVFNPASPELARDVGAKAVRIFVARKTLEQGAQSPMVKRLAQFKRAGLTVVVTLAAGKKHDKAPLPPIGSPDWLQLTTQFEPFFSAAGRSIDYLAIGNEPTMDMDPSDFAVLPNGRIPAIEYFKELAGRVRGMMQSDPSLSHVVVSSPSIFNLQFIGKKGHGDGHRALALLEWEVNDPNIDVIDLHTHVAQVSEIEEALTIMQKRTRKPIIITEWSQAPAGDKWMEKHLDSSFAQKWRLNPSTTNRAFIKTCYKTPIDKVQWDEFISKAPFDPSFMQNAFSIMINHGVEVATYGAQEQSGNIDFDAKQLLVNLTVVPGPNGQAQENYLYSEWYRNLSRAHDAGLLR